MFFYPFLSQKSKKKIQNKRLKKLVAHAKANSPYFKELYKDIGEDFKLEDLPIINKQELMEHFDDWVADRDVTKAGVDEFFLDLENIDRKLCGKYLAASTSGSTGVPAYIIQNDSQQWISAVETYLRAFKMRAPVVGISFNNGFGMDNGPARQYAAKKTAFITNKFYSIIDSTQPANDILRQINERKPKVVLGYPSTLLLLTEPEVTETLKVRPKAVMTGGESLSDSMRKKLEGFFGCGVHSIYGSTEGGAIGFECEHNHLHINTDWTIIEPIDENGKVITDETPSDAMLLTNLGSFPQPLIRYLITDTIVMHTDGCPCGSKEPWMEVQGRSNDILRFEVGNGNTVPIPPMELMCIFEDTPGMRSFQLVLHPGNLMELRCTAMPNVDKQELFAEAKKRTLEYLKENGVPESDMYLADIDPVWSKNHRKLRQIYQMDE